MDRFLFIVPETLLFLRFRLPADLLLRFINRNNLIAEKNRDGITVAISCVSGVGCDGLSGLIPSVISSLFSGIDD